MVKESILNAIWIYTKQCVYQDNYSISQILSRRNKIQDTVVLIRPCVKEAKN